MRSSSPEAEADFEGWYLARRSSLTRTAFLLTGDRHAAEDLVQSTVAKVYFAWDRIRDRQHVDAYARRVMVNQQNSWWRRPVARRELLTDHLPEHPDPRTLDSSRAADLDAMSLIVALPARQRAVLVLRYYEDLSEAQIAEALGISPGTVKAHASRGLAALRSRLSEDAQFAASQAPCELEEER